MAVNIKALQYVDVLNFKNNIFKEIQYRLYYMITNSISFTVLRVLVLGRTMISNTKTGWENYHTESEQ